MTYSQKANYTGIEAEVLFLEQQIKTVKKEIKQAEAEGVRDLLDNMNYKLVELEAKLEELED